METFLGALRAAGPGLRARSDGRTADPELEPRHVGAAGVPRRAARGRRDRRERFAVIASAQGAQPGEGRERMAWRIPIVDLAAEYLEVGPAVEAAVLRVLRSQQFILGPETAAFEAELAARIGVEFAVGVSSGTDALVLALRAAGVAPGRRGGDERLHLLRQRRGDPAGGRAPGLRRHRKGWLRRRSGARRGRARAAHTRDPAGASVRALRRHAAAAKRWPTRAGIALVEDAAQAIGAARAGRRAGAWGCAGCFSFYPSKNLGGRRRRRLRHHRRPGGRRTRPALPQPRLRAGRQRTRCSARRPGSTRCRPRRCARSFPYLEGWTRLRARNARIYAEAFAGCEEIAIPGAGAGRDAGLEPVHDPLSAMRRSCARRSRPRASSGGTTIRCRPRRSRRSARRAARRGASRRPSGPAPRCSRSRCDRAARRRRSSTSPT